MSDVDMQCLRKNWSCLGQDSNHQVSRPAALPPTYQAALLAGSKISSLNVLAGFHLEGAGEGTFDPPSYNLASPQEMWLIQRV